MPKPLDRVDRYDVLFELGRGGMAAVFAARRTGPGGFDKLVALKLLLPHLAGDPLFRELFLNEAKLVAQLEHPNIVTVFDLAEHEGQPLLVMELVRGQSLRRALERLTTPEQRLPFGIQVAMSVAEGLHAAHSAHAANGVPLGIVHRDVSPENVLIGYDGRIKVADFGIAKARASAATTRTGELRGKLGYLSPEQVTRSSAVDARSDVWALGAVLYEIAYGAQPFLGENDAETLWNVTSRAVRFPGGGNVPEALRELIVHCLSRNPASRPHSAREVRDRLARLAGGVGALSCDPGAELSRAFQEELGAETDRLTAAASPPVPFALDASVGVATLRRSPHRRWPLLLVAALSAFMLAWMLRGRRSPAVFPAVPSGAVARERPLPEPSVSAATTGTVVASGLPKAPPSVSGAARVPSRVAASASAPASSPLLGNPYR